MSLKALFYPRSVAVIGASTREGSVGHEVAKNLATQGYKGRLHLVNPKGGKLFGRRIIEHTEAIKSPLDLAVIAIPAAAVVAEVRKLAKLDVKAVIVISSGFEEVGNHAGQDELVQMCERHNITLIGPNCLGVINPELKLNASFAPLMPELGNIAFVSQSGAICASVLDHARRQKLGFSKFISVGNKAMVGEVEILKYLYRDKNTKVIAMYIEQLEDIEQLRRIVTDITHGKPHKPIVVLKSGRSDQGKQAALSHTGSLGGSDDAYNALFAQIGIIRADTIDELFDFVECFARNRKLRDDDVAIITNAGGPGVLTTDALVESGLQLAKLSEETQAKLRKFLPPSASVQNPVDVLGDAPAERYRLALQTVLDDPEVDAVEIILTPQSMTEVEQTARDIVKLKKHSHKPMVVTFMGEGLVEAGVNILNENQVATSSFPELAARSLGALWDFNQWLRPRRQRQTSFPDVDDVDKEAVRKVIIKYLGTQTHLISTDDAFKILAAYGFPVPQRWVIRDVTEAQAVSQQATGSLALKIMSPDISHKSDVGGVVLDVASTDLSAAYTQLLAHIQSVQPSAKIEGVEVMPMVADEGVEIILGVTTDPQLGKQIVVGLGGIYTEVLQDVSWGLAPLTATDIERMIAHLKTSKILAGTRGKPPLAVASVTECLGRLSKLVTDFPSIKEVDINPLKVLAQEKGAIVLDARIVLA